MRASDGGLGGSRFGFRRTCGTHDLVLMRFQGLRPWLISWVPAGRSIAELSNYRRQKAEGRSLQMRSADCGKTPTEGNEGNEEDWELFKCGMREPERESGEQKLINSEKEMGAHGTRG